jgi:hypothetical protein
MEVSARVAPVSPEGPEHLLLALDKNVQAFPWESIPCLRGRPVSRVPSLPVLLDQVALGKLMQPNSARRKVNSKKTHFILNPSGDLTKTQETFEPYLKDMRERAGWRGSVGQPPTEMEMRQILEGNDLVLWVPPSLVCVGAQADVQVLWPWWRRTVYPRRQDPIFDEMRYRLLVGLFVGQAGRSGRFGSSWDGLELYDGWMVGAFLIPSRVPVSL